MDLNLVERALSVVAPGWGVRRLAHKLALEQARGIALQARGYDAARQDRRTSSWQAPATSARAEVGQGLPMVRRRSRDLVRNNEWAGNAKRKIVAQIVGTGFMPRAADWVAKGQRKKAAELWDAFSEACDAEGLMDIYGKMALAIGEVVEGGSCLLRYSVTPPEWGLTVPLQVEVLESDFLDHGRNEILKNGNVVMQGVEFDGFGRRVAYYLFDQHPGDTGVIAWKRGGHLSTRWSADQIDHVFRVDRPGQVMGVPWFAPLALRLRDAADYEEAELIRKKIEACLTVFVKRGAAPPTTLAQASKQETKADGTRLERIAPGLIAYLQDGEEIQNAAPTPSAGYAEHMMQQLLAGSAGIGIPYSMFSGDLRQADYSSLREGKLDFWAVLDAWQWHMAIPQMANKMWRRCMKAAAQRGHAVSADLPAVWAVPKRPWVDPKKDAEAALLEMLAGLELWSDNVAARGYDPEQRLEDLKELGPRLKEAGVVLAQNAAPAAAQPDSTPAAAEGQNAALAR